MLIPYNKRPLTFHEQLDRLSERGLIIDDQEQAVNVLSSISYYRLSAYWYPLRIKDNSTGKITDDFIKGSNFREIIQLYEFDRSLRLLIIDALERIEIEIRTCVTYSLSHSYGPFAHCKSENFHDDFEYEEFIEKVLREITQEKEEFIKHYKRKYEGYPNIPIWMFTEVMTMGALSKLFLGMKNKDKAEISSKYGLTHKSLSDWMHFLTYIRNVCTHHGRLWNRNLAVKPQLSKDKNWLPPLTPSNGRIFYVLLIMKYLLQDKSYIAKWKKDCEDLITPVAENRLWRRAMGMPDDWLEHPVWK